MCHYSFKKNLYYKTNSFKGGIILMERNCEYKVNLASCPSCNATCVEGNDNDGQIYCANCGKSFIPKEVREVTDKEYRELEKAAKIKRTRSGWIAFVTN